jgi:hypothetical protein
VVAHASIGDEGHNVDDLPRVGVDKCFIPLLSLVILNLDDMREDDMVRVLGKVFEGNGPVVVPAANSSLGFGNRVLFGELGSGGCNALWNKVSFSGLLIDL